MAKLLRGQTRYLSPTRSWQQSWHPWSLCGHPHGHWLQYFAVIAAVMVFSWSSSPQGALPACVPAYPVNMLSLFSGRQVCGRILSTLTCHREQLEGLNHSDSRQRPPYIHTSKFIHNLQRPLQGPLLNHALRGNHRKQKVAQCRHVLTPVLGVRQLCIPEPLWLKHFFVELARRR